MINAGVKICVLVRIFLWSLLKRERVQIVILLGLFCYLFWQALWSEEIQKALTTLILVAMSMTVLFLFIVGLQKSALAKMCSQSFDMSWKRIRELLVATAFLYGLMSMSVEWFLGHFHVHDMSPEATRLLMLLAPVVIYALFRFVAFFESGRLAHIHLHILISGILVTFVGTFISELAKEVGQDAFILDGYCRALRHAMSQVSFSGPFLLSSLISVIATVLGVECLLHRFAELQYAKEQKGKNFLYPKQLHMIDLTEELPVIIRLYFSEGRIKDKISEIISSEDDADLDIVTNSYTVVKDNETALKKRALRGRRVRIIGADIEELWRAGTIKNVKEYNEKAKMIYEMKQCKVQVCPGTFDRIRLTVSGNKRAIASFSSGIAGSHLAFYTEHPLAIGFLRQYFDIKAQQDCAWDCPMRGPRNILVEQAPEARGLGVVFPRFHAIVG